MCGIVGYIGPKKVVPVIIEGLRKLEYRGYDSAGIAVVDSNGASGRQTGHSPGIRQTAKSGRSHSKSADRRFLRNRPHALGHAWPADRRKCAPASRLHGTSRGGAQRHHRELSGVEGAAAARRAQVRDRNGYGNCGAPGGEKPEGCEWRNDSAGRSGAEDR